MRFAFIIFLLLPIAGQAYVMLRTWQLLPAIPALRMAVMGLMALAFIIFFVAMSGTINHWPLGLATAAYEVGTSWLIVLLYLFLVFLCFDMLRLCHILPSARLQANGRLAAGLAIALTALFAYAYCHYNDKKRVEMTVKTAKPMDKDVKLVLVSDLHLGYHNRRADLHRWLTMLKAETPDAILLRSSAPWTFPSSPAWATTTTTPGSAMTCSFAGKRASGCCAIPRRRSTASPS